MAPIRPTRSVAVSSSTAATSDASSSARKRVHSESPQKNMPRQSARGGVSSSTSSKAAADVSPSSSATGRRRRVVRPAPPGTRNITSRQSELISQAREQFIARQRTGRPVLGTAAPQLAPGQVLTEDEKLQREVQDLMEDIGEDNRDPTYLKFLFNLDETMEEESDDSDFDLEEDEDMEDGSGEEGEDEEDADAGSDSSTDSDSDSMDDLEQADDDTSDDDAESVSSDRAVLRQLVNGDLSSDEDYEEGAEDVDMGHNDRSVLRRLAAGDFSDDEDDDYEPRVDFVESSDEEEGEEFVLLDEEENAATRMIEEKLRKKEDKAETANKKLLRTAEYGTCTLCAEDTVVDPVGCVQCANFIGCRKCANRWYRSSKSNSDDDMAKCPLCRQLWPADSPDVDEMKDLVKK